MRECVWGPFRAANRLTNKRLTEQTLTGGHVAVDGAPEVVHREVQQLQLREGPELGREVAGQVLWQAGGRERGRRERERRGET